MKFRHAWPSRQVDLHFSQQLLPFVQSFQRLTKLEFKCPSDLMILPDTNLIDDEFIRNIFHRDCSLKEVSIIPISKLTKNTIKRFSPCSLTKVKVHLTAGCDLFILFNYLPHIESFKCRMSNLISNEDMSTSTVDTPYLREFALENVNYTTEFSSIASLLKQRSSLERLSLYTKLPCESQNIDGNRLQQDLLQNLVHLKSFEFHFTVDQPIDMDKIIPTFQTDYWLKEHDWKVGGRCSKVAYSTFSYLFSLPFASTHFGLALMSSSFSQLKAAVPLSSNLFDEVQSLDIEIDQVDKTMSILKFVETCFKRIRCLSLCNTNDNLRLTLSPTELADIRFPTVKILNFHDQYYDWKHYEDLKQFFVVFPNLTELRINRYDLENAASYLYEHGSDEDILQFKHLHTSIVETDNTFQGSSELSVMAKDFKTRFRERLPNLVLRWITPCGEGENDSDDDDEDGDDDDDIED